MSRLSTQPSRCQDVISMKGLVAADHNLASNLEVKEVNGLDLDPNVRNAKSLT